LGPSSEQRESSGDCIGEIVGNHVGSGRFRRPSVQPHTGARSFERGKAARAHRCHDTGKYIACACGREPFGGRWSKSKPSVGSRD
jgi:hypothetical protein